MNKKIYSTAFYRTEKQRNFTIVPNAYLKREDLSWRAKGILTYLLSLPDDWSVYASEIQRHATEGRTAFNRAWKELKDAGYIFVYSVRVNGKIAYWQTDIYEEPVQSPKLHQERVKKQREEKERKKELKISFSSEKPTPLSNSEKYCIEDNVRKIEGVPLNLPPVPIKKIITRKR